MMNTVKGKKEDTIAALSTPPGRGAIAVIRLSGPDALGMTGKVFSAANKMSDRTAVYGTLYAGNVRDKAVAVYYAAPRSYTGDDVVELSVHGSPVITEAALRTLIDAGCRAAEKGEFTKRAFENGKLDLTQAEGVIDLIDSDCESAARAAYTLSYGALRRSIDGLSDKITAAAAGLNAAIDYPEEDLEETGAEKALEMTEAALTEAKKLAGSYSAGKKAQQGVSVVIAGAANAGKSTLLNALVGYERAIVTEEEGTTRDTVEDSYVYRGCKYNVTDTAGLRQASAAAERMGMERSVAAVKSCDVLLLLSSRGERPDAAGERARLLEAAGENGCRVLRVRAKSDLSEDEGDKERYDAVISALTGEGVEFLKQLIAGAAEARSSDDVMIVNLRQYQAVRGACAALEEAIKSLKAGAAAELVSVDLMAALKYLGDVTGVNAQRRVVDEIFARFCVGK